MTSLGDMTYDQANNQCGKDGALLAEIHDRTQQNDLYNFVATKMPGFSQFVQIWFGMEYKHSVWLHNLF